MCINGRKSWHTKVEADMEHWGTKQPISDILMERVQRPTLQSSCNHTLLTFLVNNLPSQETHFDVHHAHTHRILGVAQPLEF